MAKPALSYEEKLNVMALYQEHKSFDKVAHILQLPIGVVIRAIYKLEGKCDCGRIPEEGKVRCEICIKRSRLNKNRRYQELKEQGLCVQCGEPREDSPSAVYCKEHHEQGLMAAKVRRVERGKLGLCLTCGSTLDCDHPSYCSKHAPANRNRSYQARNKNKFGGLLEQVLERDGRKCVICGEDKPRLEIHHKTKGGGNTLANLDTLCMKCHHALTDLYNCANPQAVLDYLLRNPQ